MDKRDFYREIMEEYTFDKERIYINAKNGKYKGKNKIRSRSVPIYLGMTAAAAAIVVTVGTVAVTRLGGQDAVNPIPPNESYAASSNDVQIESGKNDVKSNVDPVTDESSTSIVSEMNIGGESNSDSSWIGDNESSDSSISESESTVDSSVSEPPESNGTAESSSTGSVVEPPAPPVYELENRIIEVDVGNTPSVTLPNDSSAMPVPTNVLIAMPEGGVLPFNPDRFNYLTENIGAQQAYFLNDNTFYVRNENDVRLYTVADGTAVLADSKPCTDVKVFWIAENGGRLLAFGADRTLYDVDANSGAISMIPLDNAVGTGEIFEIAYNEEAQILALNVFENGSYSLKIFEGGFGAANVQTLYTSTTAFSLVAANSALGENSVFFAAYNGSDLCIYKATVDNEVSVAATIQGQYEVTVNPAFTHAVLTNDRFNLIFDPASFGLVSIPDAAAYFGVSRHSFLGSEGYFTIDNGIITPDGGISVIAKMDFKRSFSRYYIAAVENGAVRIVNGIYTDRAKNDYLTFETPAENANSDMRSVVNAAVGLQNALAGGLCEDCGITDTETLDTLLSFSFSENAAAELKKRCAIGDGEALQYSNGYLYQINLSDTVLVITEETEEAANGTLYINAGSFDGRTAYYSCSVKLKKTESGYAADCIIE